MEKYTMMYKRESGSKYDTVKTADARVYTVTIEAPDVETAEKQLVIRETNAGIGRKIRIIRTITEK